MNKIKYYIFFYILFKHFYFGYFVCYDSIPFVNLCIFIYLFIYLISRRFCPKRLTNEGNRSNQNQQKSNNMQVLYVYVNYQ